MNRVITIGLLAGAFVCASGVARAASVAVGASCSMRNAVASVNNNSATGGCVRSGTGTINVINVPSGTFTEGAELYVNRSVTIIGAGRDSTTFTSGGIWAFMASGANAPVFEVRNMTVRKSSSQPLPCMGLRVEAPARLVLNNVRVAGFNASGGVWLSGGTGSPLVNTITNSLIENNVVAGVRMQDADLTISGSTISGNSGGLELFDWGYLNVDDSTIRDNTATDGGGIYVDGGSSAQVRVHRSLIRNNRATNYGGGIYSEGQIYFYNSTFTGNRALRGGAYYHVGAESYLYNNTISGNTGDQRAGGLYNNSGQSLWYYNIIANNTAPTNPDAEVVFITSGYNLIENTSGWSPGFSSNEIRGLDPKLGALTTYGSTRAFPLLATSPAIDRIPLNTSGMLAVDQRNQSRPVNGPDGSGRNGYDMGSIEQRP
jgi:predicted outer membrane repeat protein